MFRKPSKQRVFKHSFLLVLLLLSCWLGSPQTTFAQNPLILTDSQGEYHLGKHLEYLEDKESRWTIADVTSPLLATKFVASQEDIPNFGLTTATYWARIRIKNETAQTRDWRLGIDYPYTDLVVLYLPQTAKNANSKFNVKQTGDALPFTSREIPYRFPIFKLTLAPKSEKTLYFQFKSTESLGIQLSLWEPEVFAQYLAQQQFIFGLYYGFLFIMVLYNLALYIPLRESCYLYYVCYVACLGLHQFTKDGLASQYLWPQWVWWNNISLILFLEISLFSVTYFASSFLRTKERNPRIDQILAGIKLGWGILILLTFGINYQTIVQYINIFVLLTIIIGIGIGFISWLKGYYPARYFVIAWSLIGISGSIYILSQLGLLPANFFTEQSVRLGIVSQTVLFSLGMTDQINQMKKEKAAALEQACKVNEELELRVTARTADLLQVNEHLKTLNTRFSAEITLAYKIQASLLPAAQPNYPDLEIVCYNMPAQSVGGDFYAHHTFAPQQRKYAVAVGDVSGKGVSAALLMAASLSLFDTTFHLPFSPAERIAYLDEAMQMYTKSCSQNCALCYLEIVPPQPSSPLATLPKAGELIFVNAGGIPPYLRRAAGELVWAEVGGFALGHGLGSKLGYQTFTYSLTKGDFIILVSDGVVEAKNEAGEMFGFERLEKAITLAPSKSSNAQAMLTYLRETLSTFVGAAEPHDDLTIVTIQV